ncbi:MAG TPA: tail fiber domain-containing protein, partial [Verrucomicrobiae bacterium]|nr:tail fiber domain-containing protein [Verrucomicrobiae bacterium]
GVRFTSGSGAANQTVAWTPGSAGWSFSSDRNLKDRFKSVDSESVLARVSQLPIVEWSYKGYPQRHIGAMAQDFHAAFPLNDDDKSLNEADLHGVELAAIKALNKKLNERDAAIQDLKQQNESLEKRLDNLEQVVKLLSDKN